MNCFGAYKTIVLEFGISLYKAALELCAENSYEFGDDLHERILPALAELSKVLDPDEIMLLHSASPLAEIYDAFVGVEEEAMAGSEDSKKTERSACRIDRMIAGAAERFEQFQQVEFYKDSGVVLTAAPILLSQLVEERRKRRQYLRGTFEGQAYLYTSLLNRVHAVRSTAASRRENEEIRFPIGEV